MSTTRQENERLARIFKGRQERTGPHKKCGALPDVKPYLRLNRFQGNFAVKKKRELFPSSPSSSPSSVALPLVPLGGSIPVLVREY